MRRRERRMSLHVGKIVGAVREQVIAVGQDVIEPAMPCDLGGQRGQRAVQFGERRLSFGVAQAQGVQQVTECLLAVGRAHRPIVVTKFRIEIFECAVVGKDPVSPPQFAHERMGVDQGDFALGRLADMRDDVLAADRVVGDQLGHRRVHRRPGVDEYAAAGPFEERHAKTVGVVTGTPAALMESSKRKTNVGGYIAVHPQQLAHFFVYSPVSLLT